jgi:pimeloyl-ACP methyl ester carboxylesterase
MKLGLLFPLLGISLIGSCGLFPKGAAEPSLNYSQNAPPLAPAVSASLQAQNSDHIWVDRSPHTIHFLQVNGVRLHYLDWGGHGEPLLFLAGLGNNGHVFDSLAPRFISQARVLAMTRRGFGLSDKPETGYDIDTRVEDIRAFLDALKINRVNLVGHSIAGDELTAFAARYPNRVGRLIYLDAAIIRSEGPYADAVRSGKEQPTGAPSIPEEAFAALNAYLGFFHKEFSDVWCEAFEANLRDAIRIRDDGSVERLTPVTVYRAIMKGSVLADLDYTHVKPPTLSFYSDPMTVTDAKRREQFSESLRRDIERLRESGPHIRIVQIPGANHYLFIDHLDEVVKEMKTFL